MDQEIRGRRENVRHVIDERANKLREGGMHPFQVQKLRAAAGQELARAVPDMQKYHQAANLATQYVQKKAA